MSDNGTNTTVTTEYDYSLYDEIKDNTFAPCDSNDVNGFGKVFLPTLYSLVFILGFLGNSLVVCVLVKHRSQINLTDICLLNLALSDLLFVITLPLYSHYSVVSEWIFGDFMCRFTAVSHNTGFFSGIFFIVVMTLDRYVVIMHAHTMTRYRTLKAGVVLTILIWMLSLSVSLPAFVFTKVSNESSALGCHQIQDSDTWRLYNLVSINILGLVIPLLVMIVCYSRIIPTLVQIKSARKHRVVKLIISIVVVFFLFWAPYNIGLFLWFLKSNGKLEGDECNLEATLRLTVTVTEAFAYTHCCLNPIIYALVGERFMKRAVQLLRNWVPGIRHPSTRDSSDSSYRKSSLLSRSSDVTSVFMK
ncbi:C-C chemokine receptor type 1-like [Antennarius striatus]|uniref:C-C chemokine receptor type 1-like n=1 Tax=Antennarius striatus TaxID=241820 RepID=UPI0035ADDEC0